MDDEAEDAGSNITQLVDGDDCDDDNRLKRKRLDGCTSPANVDVSSLIGEGSVFSDPSRQNRFSILADLEIENVGHDKNVRRNNNTYVNGASVSEKPMGPANRTFCPPIILYNVNIKGLSEQLEAKSPKIHFKIKNVNRQKSKLYISDTTVHAEMMSILREKNIKSYSFTPKELKQVSLVIRGLYYKCEVDEIKAALDNVVPGVISKVSKFTTSFSKKSSLDTGLFLISLMPGSKLGDVSGIKYLMNQTITWEKPKRKEKEIQCYRCQHWGHISKNCNSVFKCVKCSLPHQPGSCPRDKSKDSDPFCVNCGESGHPANWRGCEVYKKYLSNKNERMTKAREVKSTANNNIKKVFDTSTTTPGRSFASLFKSKPLPEENSRKSKSPIIDEFLNLAKYFMEPEEQLLDREINQFLQDYKNMSKSEAKPVFLRLLNKVKSIYGP